MQVEKGNDGPGDGLNADVKHCSHAMSRFKEETSMNSHIRGFEKLRTGAKKEWVELAEREERGREKGGRVEKAEKKGDVTSISQPIGGREGERERGRARGRRRVCFSITAASAEGRGAQSISQRRGRKDASR